MLIEVNDNLFINAKNISYIRIKKNHIDFTELGNDHIEDFKISDEGEKALADGAELIFTLDTHYKDYLKTGEGKHLPVEHCIEGTDGWKIVDELQDLATNAIMIPKEHFGSNLWTEYIQAGDEVTMVGFVSSICVVSNALAIKQIENVEVNVIKDCCAGLTDEDHEAAMTVMKCCQCNII